MNRIYANTARVQLTWPVAFSMPPGSGYYIYASEPDGEVINFDQPLNSSPVEAWPIDRSSARGGLGRGSFGGDYFGGNSAGSGFAADLFGRERFGRGGFFAQYTTAELRDGTYLFAVCSVSDIGNINLADYLQVQITVSGKPYPPTSLTVTGYDELTDTATVTWTNDPRNTITEGE